MKQSLENLISIIIPVYNRAHLILRALESVLSQDYKNKEIFVVDDGSTDDLASLLESYVNQGLINYLKQENQGVSSARNSGIKASSGQLLAFLDSDDQWLPGKLTAQAAYMEKNPHLQLVQCQEGWIRNGRRVNPRRKHIKKEGDIFLESVELCLISPSAVMLRRSLLDEVGLFDEKLAAAEDYDLWLRVLARYEAGLIDKEYVLRYGGHGDQLSSRHSIDRYRVMALEKILQYPLSQVRREKVEQELERRRRIYLNGLAKREAD